MPLVKFVIEKDEEEKEENFVMDWMDELGWDSRKGNPFEDIIPQPIGEFIAGYKDERSKINIFIISNHPYGTIKGTKGTGKTVLLRWLENQLLCHQERIYPAYVNCNEVKSDMQFIQEIIKPTLGFFDRWFRRKKWGFLDPSTVIPFMRNKLFKRRMVILLDNVGKIEKTILQVLNQLIDSDLKIQFVISGSKSDIEKANLHYHKDDLKVELQKMPYEEIRDLIKNRIEAVGGDDIVPFTDTLLKKISSQANYNPREVLKQCRSMAVKSTVFHKLKYNKKELAPPTPHKDKHNTGLKKYEKIKEKVETINYIKKNNKNKKKPDVEVIENKKSTPSNEEYADLDEKEKNDKLISELFDKK